MAFKKGDIIIAIKRCGASPNTFIPKGTFGIFRDVDERRMKSSYKSTTAQKDFKGEIDIALFADFKIQGNLISRYCGTITHPRIRHITLKEGKLYEQQLIEEQI